MHWRFIAVDRATKENGCLQVLKGSHLAGRVDHVLTGEQAGADPERVNELARRLELAKKVQLLVTGALPIRSLLLPNRRPPYLCRGGGWLRGGFGRSDVRDRLPSAIGLFHPTSDVVALFRDLFLRSGVSSGLCEGALAVGQVAGLSDMDS